MRLYQIGDLSRRTKNREVLFPGSKVASDNSKARIIKKTDKAGGKPGLIKLLTTATAKVLPYSEIKAVTGIDLAKNGHRFFPDPEVVKIMAEHGWQRGKTLGGRGNGGYLYRPAI